MSVSAMVTVTEPSLAVNMAPFTERILVVMPGDNLSNQVKVQPVMSWIT